VKIVTRSSDIREGGQAPDPDGFLAAIVAGIAIGAVLGILAATIIWQQQVQAVAPIAVAAVATVAGGAIGAISATVRRRGR
jgi:hypothetical protein